MVRDPSPRTSAVLVTGASTGIGRATALLLDAAGHPVFAGVRRDEDGEELRAEASRRLRPVLLDVTDGDDVARVAAELASEAPEGLFGLVNNAGVVRPGPLEYLPLEDLREQLEVNVTGVVAVTQACLPLLRRGAGRVVNVGSASGYLAAPLMGAYSASKFALEALSDALRLELRGAGVAVVVIEPGRVETPIWEKGIDRSEHLLVDPPEGFRERYGALVDFMRRFARRGGGVPAERVAEVILRALTSRRPRARYRVGRDAHLHRVLAALPDRIRDVLLLRATGGG